MERWSGRVAMVTGASSGIGAAIVKELVLKGMKVVGLARRVEMVENLKNELKAAPGQLYPLKCDVSQEADILAAFDWLTKNLGGVDVLVNNAGIARCDANLVDGPTKSFQEVLQVNVLGLTLCTREALKSMRARGVDDGHIVHINSICGHSIISYSGDGIGIYSASKYAVTALTESLRLELVKLKSRIRVTSISPGVVKTEINMASGQTTSMDSYDKVPHLEAADIADSVIYVLGAPAHVQIHELTIKPVGESF